MINIICNIYIIKNKINDKVYVGQTWQSLSKRFSQHKKISNGKRPNCTKLLNALNAHGRENFYIESLIVTKEQSHADFLEDLLIKQFDSIKNGYNIRDGGFAGHTPWNKGRKATDEEKKIMSENHHMLGKHHSSETKNKMKIAHKNSNKGENNPMFGKTGFQNPFFGKKHSAELMNKITQKAKETKRNKKLAKQMQQFYQSTIYYNLEI